jgi:hypothetical protein
VIFAVQRFVEDYLSGVGVDCTDDYAITTARIYTYRDSTATDEDVVSAFAKVRTPIFRNAQVNRADVERGLVAALRRKFKKKALDLPSEFRRTVEVARRKGSPPTRIRSLLEQFAKLTRAKGISAFWSSRATGHLKRRPESIANGMLQLFVSAALRGKGAVVGEMQSGTGFVDVTVVLSVTHLVELKILKSGPLKGVHQLGNYMTTESRKVGWLVVFDARSRKKKRVTLPSKLTIPSGIVHVIVVDINPPSASSLG